MSTTAPLDSASPEQDTPSLSFLGRLRQSIVLPKAVSAFEQSYLRRMNTIAFWFFCAHVPAIMLIAWANGTGTIAVGLMALAVLGVPVLGCRALTSERSKSYVYAFTSMSMGAVLVHAGQGPVQIEMHFYFFSVLAMLALFANPMTVIVGAATVAVQHLSLWYLAPSSMFNYEAPLWVVLVHAAFVVLETFAACFIARNFFDNVIGLEKKVAERTTQLEERNREMQIVLDSIDEGIVTVDADCRLQPEHSSSIVEYFGEFEAGETFADFLSRSCVATAEWFSMNWEAVGDDFLPLELALDQLPKTARIEGNSYEFHYRPKLAEDGELESVLIVVSDITGDVARAHAEALQRELLTMLDRALKDEAGFAAFHTESSQLLEGIGTVSDDGATDDEKRALHTMKGNAGAFGLGSVATACHALEDAWAEGSLEASKSAYASLKERWDELGQTAERLMSNGHEGSIRVPLVGIEELLNTAVEAGATDVAVGLADLLLEPTSPALDRLEAQAKQIAVRLDRDPLNTSVDSHDVCVQRASFQPLWSALVHVIRNAIDHGIEAPEDREEASKEAAGNLSISTEVVDTNLVVTIEDDGRGIDWERVREKAIAGNLPHSSHDDLIAALFTDNLSTRESVSELSGRGVGLSAVSEVMENLQGSISVTSTPGEGTRMQFEVPLGHLLGKSVASSTGSDL